MSTPAWTPDETQLLGNLHHLRRILDQRVPRVTTIPELARIAMRLRPSHEGLAAILATVRLAIDRLPDTRGPVAECLYGLTDESASQRVRTRRLLAMAAYQQISKAPAENYEAFRTGAERILIADLATVLTSLAEDLASAQPSITQESGVGPRHEHHARSQEPASAGNSPTRTALPSLNELTEQVAQQTFTFIDALLSPRLRLLGSHVESTCDFLYRELLGYLVDVLAGLLVDFVEAQNDGVARLEPRRDGAHAARVLLGNCAYVVAAETRASRPYEVEISMSAPTTRTPAFTTQVPLSNEGRFVLASLAFSPELADAEPWATEATRGVLDNGDRAIEAFVVSQLAFDVTGAVAELYGLVRRYFAREIAETIRLFILDPQSGGGMHVDHAAQVATMGSLHPGHGVEGLGSAEKLLRLAVARFPVADSVAAEIVPNMQTVVRSPLRIPSAREVGGIQSELFGEEMTLQPLLSSDRLWIEAGYPASLRSAIEPTLMQHRALIAARASELDFGPTLREPIGDTFDLAAARGRRDQFRRDFGHLIAGYPSE